MASSAEAAQAIGFMAIFPLTFASSSFVPVESMPGWLEAFAEVNPFTTMTDAMRSLWVDTPAGNDIWLAVVWCAGLIAVFAPLSVGRHLEGLPLAGANGRSSARCTTGGITAR